MPRTSRARGACGATRRRRSTLQSARARAAARARKLAWQLAELDKLAPQPGEWDEVSNEHKRLSHSANLIEGVRGALNALSESDDAMLAQLGAIVSKLRSLADYDTSLGDALASLEPAEIQLQEAVYSLQHYAQRVDLDPERLAQVETRLDALHSTARKFRLPPDTLHEEHAARRAQLAALDAAADLGALVAAQARRGKPISPTPNTCPRHARRPPGARHGRHGRHAGTVDGGRELRSRARAARRRRPHETEQVEFRVAGHPGVPLRPLAKVASGGELARISLALAVIASAASPTPTLIFDEVDTGSAAASPKWSAACCTSSGGIARCCA